MGILGDFVWSNKVYTPESLLDTQLVKFPIIVRVSRGYKGRNDVDRIGLGEILRVETFTSHKRIVAVDGSQRVFSLSEDFPIMADVISRKKSWSPIGRTKRRYLKEMTLHPEAFPVSVQFGTRKDHFVLINGQMVNAADLGTLELIKVEYETFLVGHRIKNGILHPKFKVIRTLAPIEMELATGLTVGTELDWARLQDMYTRAAEASDTEAKPSLPHIMIIHDGTLDRRDHRHSHGVDSDGRRSSATMDVQGKTVPRIPGGSANPDWSVDTQLTGSEDLLPDNTAAGSRAAAGNYHVGNSHATLDSGANEPRQPKVSRSSQQQLVVSSDVARQHYGRRQPDRDDRSRDRIASSDRIVDRRDNDHRHHAGKNAMIYDHSKNNDRHRDSLNDAVYRQHHDRLTTDRNDLIDRRDRSERSGSRDESNDRHKLYSSSSKHAESYPENSRHQDHSKHRNSVDNFKIQSQHVENHSTEPVKNQRPSTSNRRTFYENVDYEEQLSSDKHRQQYDFDVASSNGDSSRTLVVEGLTKFLPPPLPPKLKQAAKMLPEPEKCEESTASDSDSESEEKKVVDNNEIEADVGTIEGNRELSAPVSATRSPPSLQVTYEKLSLATSGRGTSNINNSSSSSEQDNRLEQHQRRQHMRSNNNSVEDDQTARSSEIQTRHQSTSPILDRAQPEPKPEHEPNRRHSRVSTSSRGIQTGPSLKGRSTRSRSTGQQTRAEDLDPSPSPSAGHKSRRLKRQHHERQRPTASSLSTDDVFANETSKSYLAPPPPPLLEDARRSPSNERRSKSHPGGHQPAAKTKKSDHIDDIGGRPLLVPSENVRLSIMSPTSQSSMDRRRTRSPYRSDERHRAAKHRTLPEVPDSNTSSNNYDRGDRTNRRVESNMINTAQIPLNGTLGKRVQFPNNEAVNGYENVERGVTPVPSLHRPSNAHMRPSYRPSSRNSNYSNQSNQSSNQSSTYHNGGLASSYSKPGPYRTVIQVIDENDDYEIPVAAATHSNQQYFQEPLRSHHRRHRNEQKPTNHVRNNQISRRGENANVNAHHRRERSTDRNISTNHEQLQRHQAIVSNIPTKPVLAGSNQFNPPQQSTANQSRSALSPAPSRKIDDKLLRITIGKNSQDSNYVARRNSREDLLKTSTNNNDNNSRVLNIGSLTVRESAPSPLHGNVRSRSKPRNGDVEVAVVDEEKSQKPKFPAKSDSSNPTAPDKRFVSSVIVNVNAPKTDSQLLEKGKGNEAKVETSSVNGPFTTTVESSRTLPRPPSQSRPLPPLPTEAAASDTKNRPNQQQRDQYQNKTLTKVKNQDTGKRRPATPDSRTSTLTSIDGRALRLNNKNGTITSLDIAAASANMSLAELERYLDGLATPTPTVDEYNAVL